MADMFHNFLTVGTQVLVLFLLIGVGVICTKAKLLTKEAVRSMADILLLVATPCVIVHSFQRPVTPDVMRNLGIAALAAIGVHVLGIALAQLLCHDKDKARERVLRFGVVFSNAGYMAIPLQQALLGDDGVFFGAVYVGVFNLALWTYGVSVMGNGVKDLSVKKVLISPGLIGVTIGLFLLLCGITLPEIIAAPVGHLANLNTPLPMLIIGYYLAGANIKEALRDRASYLAIALRLLAIPLITLGILWLCGVRGTVLVSAVIGASAPVATATTMFSAKFDRAPTLSVNLVVLSTLLSVISMPLIVGLASFLR